MAYTPIDKGENFFNTKLYTGNGPGQAITGVGFQPDFLWIKARGQAYQHSLRDVIRGSLQTIRSNGTNTEVTQSASVNSFDSNGFTLGVDSNSFVNQDGVTYASWNWIGANPPKKTYIVKVVSDGGNKYRFDDFGTNAVTLELSEGGTFIFDQSDSSNNGHPLRFSTTSNGTHAGGSIYTTGVVVSGTPGQAGAKTTITVAASAPTLYYFCTVHSGMGGQANTPTTNSFTNLDGSIQSNVSPNTISRFSIVKYTGTGSAGATVGHGLGATPAMIIVKNLNAAVNWCVYHKDSFTSQSAPGVLYLNTTAGKANDTNVWGNSSVTINATVFSLGNYSGTNGSGNSLIAYCFADVQGYSKFGSYEGNGNADGPFTYTGFKPAFVMVKNTGAAENWIIFDNKRPGINLTDDLLKPNLNNAESSSGVKFDLVSNGFKARVSDAEGNSSGGNFIYMAFAENPFTSSSGTPVTAR